MRSVLTPQDERYLAHGTIGTRSVDPTSPATAKGGTMWARAVIGIVLAAVGTVFLLQGTNVLHGSGMSGEGTWAIVGAVLIVVGLALLAFAVRSRRGRSTDAG